MQTPLLALNLKTIALSLAILLAPFILLKLDRKKDFAKELHLDKFDFRSTVIQGLGLFAMAFVTLVLVGLVLTALGLADNRVVVGVIQAQNPLTLLLAVTIGPLGEELLFRGYLLKKIGLAPQAVLFGILHVGYGSISEIIAALSVGFLFGIFMLEKKNMHATIFAHALYNLFSIIAVFGVIRA